MSGLSSKDLDILKSYANAGNRELYWNYLSQLPGADGYGTLALGVVRNDSLPGQVANRYAQDYAKSQQERGSRFPNAELTERQWDEFGQSLLLRDLERREYWMGQQRPDLALNLPGKDVMLAHDLAFDGKDLDPNCWTPRVLLQEALKKSGPDKVEEIWTNMLDNNVRGVARAWNTAVDAHEEMGASKTVGYIGKLTGLEGASFIKGLDTVNPNIIGSRLIFHTFNQEDGTWRKVYQPSPLVPLGLAFKEKDASVINELNDTRSLRLERQEKSQQFHPDDPYRTITPSPWTVSVDEIPDALRPATRLADIGPGHPEHNLHQQVREHVTAIDTLAGRTPDENSERLIAGVMVLARQNNLDRADHVLLSAATAEHAAGRNVFVVQGDLSDPAHRRACMLTDLAIQTSVEQSLQKLEAVGAERVQALAQTQQQEMDNRVRDNPAVRMA